MNRVDRENLTISNIDVETTIEAFKMGLKKDSPFYEDLVMTPCKRMDEVRSKALRFIRREDEKEIQKMSNHPKSYDYHNRKTGSLVQKSYKSKTYSKPIITWLMLLRMKDRKMNFPRSLIIVFSWMFQV